MLWFCQNAGIIEVTLALCLFFKWSRLPPLVRAFLTRLSSRSAAEQTWQLALTLQQPLPWLESTAPFSQPRQSPRVSLATEAW